nr:hypothetical protein [Tanacetum cinerariifolium]
MNELQEMSIKDMKDLKHHFLDEMISLTNDLQIKDYRNEKIDIRFRKECESMIYELKGKFNGMSIENNKKKEFQQLEQVANLGSRGLSHHGNEELSTIPEKESNEFIKSCVKDLVLILSESEDTSKSDSECNLPSYDDFSPINVSEEKFVTFSNPLFESNDDFTSSDDELLSDEDIPEDNVKCYSNPLFDFDDEYIYSDVNPLFDEDECFSPGDDIELLLHRDSSTPKMSVVYILEGFIDETPLEENDDLFNLEFKKNDWKKILYDAPIDDLLTDDKIFDPGGNINEIDAFLDIDISTDIKDSYYDSKGDILYIESLLSDDTTPNPPPAVFLDRDQRSLSDINDLKIMVKVFDLGIHERNFSPTYVSLSFEDRQYLFFTYVIRIFLPYFTYLVVSPSLPSSRSEDTIFDPSISAFHFSSLESVASHRSGNFMCFYVYPNILNESPMEIFSSTRFNPNIMMIWGESS